MEKLDKDPILEWAREELRTILEIQRDVDRIGLRMLIIGLVCIAILAIWKS